MDPEALPLIVGLPGAGLGWSERSVLEAVKPAGIVLFARNVESISQMRELILQLSELEPAPFLSVDLEGGLVNRFEILWGKLPTPATAAAAGRRAVRALGEAAGAACHCLGIHMDYAPVVDLDHEAGFISYQGRALSGDHERAAALAKVFNEGLKAWCVSGCAKHFPGLGAIPVDTHESLPVLELDRPSLQPHLDVFSSLSQDVPAVMVGHVVVPSLGDNENPASLSTSVIEAASELPGSPVILTDDLEMGAIGGLGTLPELVIRAFKARNHGAIVSRSFPQLEEIADTLRSEAARDDGLRARLREATARVGTLRRDLGLCSASLPAPDETTVEQLWEKARNEAEKKAPMRRQSAAQKPLP
jgi:beta-N-acetylhexosaminidase